MTFKLKISIGMYILICLLFGFVSPAISYIFGISGIPISHILLILLPLLAVTYLAKYEYKTVFMLRKIQNQQYLTKCVFLWMGAIIVSFIYSYLTVDLFDTKELVESFEYIFANTNLVQRILIMAILPAIIEELMFRGFLLSSFLNEMKPIYAILLSGILFAIMHFSPAKLFTTFLLGTIFAFASYKTDSVYSAMILHFINNIFSVFISQMQ